ncbi:MAG: type II toxin-antitoxin system RelE/ParE family toxin [Chitinophagaceae bacterium]
MIVSFKHKGLRLLWEQDNQSKLPPAQRKKIKILLQVIDELKDVPRDLENLMFAKPHPLKGDLSGYWSLSVSGNYRIIFLFKDGRAEDVDYIDYH